MMTTTARAWVPTRIEELRAFDIVHFNHSIWVIQRILRNDNGQFFMVTRVDDGKQTKWAFFPESHGYLIERMVA